MKTSKLFNFRAHIIVALGLAALTTAAHAASLTWDANNTGANQTDGGGSWLNANQWWTGSANQTWASGADAIFGKSGTGGAVTLVSPTTVNSLTMNSFSGTYTLGSAGQTITLNNGLTNNPGAGAVTISSPVTLGGVQTWLNNSANTLTINGAVDNSGNLLTIDGSSPTTYGAVTLSGAGGLTKNGSGVLNLRQATLSYTGPTTVNGGIVMLGGNKPTGNWTLNNGMLDDYYRSSYTFSSGLGAGVNQIQIYGDSGFGGGNGASTWQIGTANSILQWGSTYFNPTSLKFLDSADNLGPSIYGDVQLSNGLDLNGGARTIYVLAATGASANNAWGKITGVINDTAGGGSLIKTGGGLLILTGANTYNGGTTVSAGTLQFNAANAIAGSGRNVTVANGATVAAGYAMDNTFLGRLAENTNVFTVALGAASSANLDFNTSAGAMLPTASLGAVGTYTYSGTLTPNGTTYRLGGGGTLTVSSALTGGNSLVVGGAIQLNAANSFSGDTLIQSGTLSVNTNLALQNSAIDTSGSGVIAILTGATSPTIGGLKGSKNITALITSGYGSVTNLTLNPAAGVTNSYSGVITNGAPGMALTKTGSGTQILSGANTYTGPTTVSGGMLALSQPTLATNSTITVASNAVVRLDFAGTNTVSGLVLNGVSQSSGVYNSTTASPYITGTGSLLVVLYDTDGDGIPDWWMMKYFGHPTGLASDYTRAQDDYDGDGLTNLQEYQLGTDPTKTDTDGDGLSDGDEVNIYHTDPTKADTDGDGLTDYQELFIYHTDPLNWDTDSDGLSDGDEVNIYHTNPLLADTDGDGVGDWYEVTAVFTNPTNSASKPSIPYPLPRPNGSKGVTNKPVKVFILSGQSNMVGMGDVNGTDANGVALPGTLNFITKVQNKFPDLVNTNGNWSVWSNVMYRGVVTALGNAPLQPGQGASSGNLGPELGFGRVMGYYMNEPVLLIKSSQGNRGLFWDILPPGSPRYTNGTTVYAGYGEGPSSWSTTNGGPSPYIWYAGKQYDDFFLAGNDMGFSNWTDATDYQASGNLGSQVHHNGTNYICKASHTSSSLSEPGVGAQSATYWNVYTIENVTTVLDNFATQYPQWAAQGFEISGYVWFQGNWDLQSSLTANRYETNLLNLIKTLRQYYANRYPGKCSTNTPFVLATGCGDPGTSGNGLIVANAQLAMNDTNKYPAFAGNVKTMDTRAYWRDLSVSPNAQGYHYYHNAETYMLTGDALARGMISMLSTGIVTTNDYSSWATNYPGANLSDPNADFDGNGLSNDYKRIWGLNPTNALSRNPFTFSSGLGSGNFSYTRRDSTLTGLNYTIWTSTNLVNWTQDTGAVQTPGAPVNQVQSVSVTVSPGLVTGSRLFIRMLAQ